jgi:peptidoglycan/LPS O-acetylase OafA/YrhL
VIYLQHPQAVHYTLHGSLPMNALRFPGLNAVRFFAASLVIIDHTEVCKSKLGYTTLWSDKYSNDIGTLGVNVFFVLSGFLITFLLLKEKETGGINVKHFYMRRVLRIWPLYFLIVALAFFVVPHIGFLNPPGYASDMSSSSTRLVLYSALMANVALVFFPVVNFAQVLWSVAVEEQFYLFWPHVFRIKPGNFLKMLCIAMLLFWCVRAGIRFALPGTAVNTFFDKCRFVSLAIGGAGAWLLFHNSVWLKFIYHRFTQRTCMTVFAALLLDVIHIPFFAAVKMEIAAMTVAVLIMNMAANPRSVLKAENRVLDYLGKISYGLYVYHMFAVIVVVRLCSGYLGISDLSSPPSYTCLLTVVFLLTIGVSHLSYIFLEHPVLRLKTRFSRFVSGDLAAVQRKDAKPNLVPASVKSSVPG